MPHPRIPLPGASFVERLLAPIHRFTRLEAASGIVLLACGAAAMIIAKGPLGHAYHDLLAKPLSITLGARSLTLSVEQWINDALMAAFFLLVGLEIKREALVGELSDIRKAAVPVLAAAGGMLVPGLIYAAFNWGQPTLRGWGIPTATDIAFSLGVLALLGSRVPRGLRVFLATLAIADDLGALVVIALFYTDQLHADAMLGAGACLAALMALNLAGVRRLWPFLVLGVFLWLFVHGSGVHATIAGVLLALTIPARTRVDASTFAAFSRSTLDAFDRAEGATPSAPHLAIMRDPTQQAAVQAIEDACNKVQTPLHQLEHALTPWIAFLIVPIFALANAGVALSGNFSHALAQPETLGSALGLILGKPLGITLTSLLAVRLGLGALPSGVTWRHLHAMAWLAGIGFTMSLFIAHLAFRGTDAAERLNDAKIGIIGGSIVAASIGFVLLRLGPPASRPPGAPS